MLTDQIVSLLIAERDKLSRAIEALQGPTKRRGRPPKNALTGVSAAFAGAVTHETPKPKKRARTFNAAQRAAAGERMRARWAAKKAAGEGKLGPRGKKAAKNS